MSQSYLSSSSLPRALAGILVLVSAFANPLPAEQTFTREKAMKSFRRTCQHCHTVPDPGQKLDLAWLNQVKETA